MPADLAEADETFLGKRKYHRGHRDYTDRPAGEEEAGTSRRPKDQRHHRAGPNQGDPAGEHKESSKTGNTHRNGWVEVLPMSVFRWLPTRKR